MAGDVTAYIGLGSNEGDRLDNLRRAVRALDYPGITVTAVSSVYETDPVGPPQPDFLNAICEVKTSLPARYLYLTLKGTEKVVGRKPGPRWGPRVIDLDLLLYADQVIEEPELTVPHPEMLNRAFVLIPLFEVAPDAALPSGQKVSETVASEAGGVRLYKKDWLKKP